MKQININKCTISQLREATGFLVNVDGVYGWYYQYPLVFDNDMEFMTVCLN